MCNDGTFYTGVTNNLVNRVYHHNNTTKGAKYTRGRRPVQVVYYEQHNTKLGALKREYKIKQLTRQEKIKLFRIYNPPYRFVDKDEKIEQI